MEPFAVDVYETARLIGVKKSKVWEMIAAGELPSFKVGRARRVPVAAIRRWIAEQSGMQAAEPGSGHEGKPAV
jgi:excisionase family DNA binding protein